MLVLAGLLVGSLFLSATAEAGPCRKKEDDVSTPHRQLDWEDFKGRWSQKVGPAAAVISSGIHLESHDALVEETSEGYVARIGEVCLYAAMAKYESAFRPGLKTERGLEHEQGHFDLTELHTRRFYQTLLDIEVKGADQREARHELRLAVAAAYEAAVAAWQKEENLYDEETVHGTRRRKQNAWLEEIAERMSSTTPAGRGREVQP